MRKTNSSNVLEKRLDKPDVVPLGKGVYKFPAEWTYEKAIAYLVAKGNGHNFKSKTKYRVKPIVISCTYEVNGKEITDSKGEGYTIMPVNFYKVEKTDNTVKVKPDFEYRELKNKWLSTLYIKGAVNSDHDITHIALKLEDEQKEIDYEDQKSIEPEIFPPENKDESDFDYTVETKEFNLEELNLEEEIKKELQEKSISVKSKTPGPKEQKDIEAEEDIGDYITNEIKRMEKG